MGNKLFKIYNKKSIASTKSNNRKYYIDILRAAATIAVVFYHSGSGDSQFLDSIIKIILNWCVPVFIMITGALFLDTSKQYTEKIIFKKTLPKILGILIFWGFFYNVSSLFIIDGVSHIAILKAIRMLVCADCTYCYQFWYLYFIVGMYVLIPIIKPWIDKNMGQKTLSKDFNIVFIFVLFVGIIVPSILNIVGYSGVYWEGAFTVFSGLAFFLICGHLLDKWELSCKLRLVLVLTWLIQLIWLLVNTLYYNVDMSKWFGYSSFFTWEMSVLLFDLIHSLTEKNKIMIPGIVMMISKDSLGIYIFHVMIIWILGKIIPFSQWGVNPVVTMFIMVILAVIISMAITELMKKIPLLRRLV